MSRKKRASSAEPSSHIVADLQMTEHSKRFAAAYWTPIGELAKWKHNPRKNDPAVPEVARSIRKYGFVAPIVVWQSAARIVAGHTRIKALESLLAEDPNFVPRDAPGPGLVPVRFHEFRDGAEANAYAIADNRLGEKAEWDDQLLGAVLEEIRSLDEGMLEFTGFDAGEITDLIEGAHPSDPAGGPADPGAQIDKADELQKKWKTAAGQLWEIPSRTAPEQRYLTCHKCGHDFDV